MRRRLLPSAIDRLKEQYLTLNWAYHDFQVGGQIEKMFRWPGPEDEDILLVVHQCARQQELSTGTFFLFQLHLAGRVRCTQLKVRKTMSP